MRFKTFHVNAKELEMGTKIEMEHTPSRWLAQKIAMDHLIEFPNYYTELIKMEKKLGKRK